VGSALPSQLPLSSGSGGTFYVDGTHGSDSGSGSASSPWQTINHALASVPLAGSIINVEPGTYSSSGVDYAIVFNRQGSTSDPVTLQAATPGTVTIANGDPSAWTLGASITDASGLRIEGINFHLTTSAVNVGADAMLIENSSRIEITGCTFYDVATQAIAVRGALPASPGSATDVWIIGNVFRPSGSDPFAQATGTGWSSDQYFGSRGSHWIYVGEVGDSSTSAGYDYSSGADRTVIANNVFSGSTAGYDVQLGPEARNGYVVNNTFYGNHSGDVIGWATDARYAGTGVDFFVDTPGASYATSNNTVVNNIFDELNGHAAAGGSNGVESGNLVQNNLAANLKNGNGSQDLASQDYMSWYETTDDTIFSTGAGNRPDADPLFVNASAFDFQPQANSPAVGTADPAYTPATDLNGNPRPSTPDLGAIQH
jgi:hypothetical protein